MAKLRYDDSWRVEGLKQQYVDMNRQRDTECIRWRDGGETLEILNRIDGLSPLEYLRQMKQALGDCYIADLLDMNCSLEEYVERHFEVSYEDVLDEKVQLSWIDIFSIYDEIIGSIEYMTLGDWFFSVDNVPHSWGLDEAYEKYQQWLSSTNAYDIFSTSLRMYDFFLDHHSGMGFIYACKTKSGLIGTLSVNGVDWSMEEYSLDTFTFDHSWANHITGLFYTNVSFYLDDNQYDERVEKAFRDLPISLDSAHGARIGIGQYHEYDLKNDDLGITYSTFRMPLFQVIRMIGYKPMSVKDFWKENRGYTSDNGWYFHLPQNVKKQFDWRWLGRNNDIPNTDRSVKTESDER